MVISKISLSIGEERIYLLGIKVWEMLCWGELLLLEFLWLEVVVELVKVMKI